MDKRANNKTKQRYRQININILKEVVKMDAKVTVPKKCLFCKEPLTDPEEYNQGYHEKCYIRCLIKLFQKYY